MKFIHAADLHLDGASAKIKTFYGQEELSIVEASQSAFISLIDLSNKHQVDFVLLSGDLFDSNWKDYALGLFFIEQIKRLNCPVYYIKGNHDAENRLLKTLPFPENLNVFGSKEPETFLLDHLKAAIHGQSYSHYHTKEDLAEKYPKRTVGYFNIGLLHTSGEKNNSEDPYAPYDKKKLEEKKYNYWALGHIHTAKIISEEPYIVYSGTSQGRNIKEVGLKGCYLVEVEDASIKTISFKVLGNIVWEVIEVDISNCLSENSVKECLKEKVLDILEAIGSDKKLVLRFIFYGKNFSEKPIYEELEYWRNSLYCYFSNEFERNLYIEKIIDKTIDKNSSSKNEDSELMSYLIDSLSIETNKERVKLYIDEDRKSLLSKLPAPVLNEINDCEIKHDAAQVSQYIKQKISEAIE